MLPFFFFFILRRMGKKLGFGLGPGWSGPMYKVESDNKRPAGSRFRFCPVFDVARCCLSIRYVGLMT